MILTAPGRQSWVHRSLQNCTASCFLVGKRKSFLPKEHRVSKVDSCSCLAKNTRVPIVLISLPLPSKPSWRKGTKQGAFPVHFWTGNFWEANVINDRWSMWALANTISWMSTEAVVAGSDCAGRSTACARPANIGLYILIFSAFISLNSCFSTTSLTSALNQNLSLGNKA